MSAARAISYLCDHGVVAALEGDDLVLTGADALPPQAIERLRGLKAELVELIRLEGAPQAPEHRQALYSALGRPGSIDPLQGVEAELERMARENEARRDWHTQPVEGWREGKLTICSATTGKETTINLKEGARR